MKTIDWIIIIAISFLTACSSGDSESPPPPPPPVTKQTLPIVDFTNNIDRISTFARVATSIEFYYPGDGAFITNWDNFIVYGMYQVASSQSDEDFVAKMKTLFANIAPDVEFNNLQYQAPTFANTDTVTAWQQNGYKDKTYTDSSVYYPQRLTLSFGALMADQTLTKSTSYHIDYGNLIMDMPLVLKKSNGLSTPGGSAFIDSAQWLLPTAFSNPYTCLASFSKAWAGIQNYWPYIDTIEVDWLAELNPMLLACNNESRKESVRQSLVALTKLQDNHVGYGGAANAFPTYSTIPVGFEWLEGKVVAIYNEEIAPAQVALGDQLIAIDDMPVEDVLNEIMPLTRKSLSKQKSTAILLYMLRRPKNALVKLTLLDEQGTSYQASLNAASDLFEMYSATTDSYTQRVRPQRQVLANNIHYVDLSNTLETDVDATIDSLAGASAVVIDFRNYPKSWNGWQNTLAHFSDNSISGPPLYYHWTTAPDRSAFFKDLRPQYIYPLLPRLTIPVIALSSRYSQSSNEHALAYIQNAGIPILGEPSSGINGNITFLYTFGGSSAGGMTLIFTGMEVTQNDGSDHIGVGILPDIYLARSIQSIKDDQDNQLDAAVQYLENQLQQ